VPGGGGGVQTLPVLCGRAECLTPVSGLAKHEVENVEHLFPEYL
jgi:hypothetical protein